MEPQNTLAVNQPEAFNEKQLALIKNQIMPGATNDELALFSMVCKRTGLDPFARQIYAIRRKKKVGDRYIEFYSPETSSDGQRSVAARTGEYAGSDDPVFDDEGTPRKATVTVWRLVNGVRCPFTASARWDQYCPKEENKQFMWKKMPHVMLGKCAEALALRKAFPQQMSGLYSEDEMAQMETQKTPANASEDSPYESPWLDEKGNVLIEGKANQVERTIDDQKLTDMPEEQKILWSDITDKLFELVGSNGKDIGELLEMCSEWRDSATGALDTKGVQIPIQLNFNRKKGRKASQAEYAFKQLSALTKETVQPALAEWRKNKR